MNANAQSLLSSIFSDLQEEERILVAAKRDGPFRRFHVRDVEHAMEAVGRLHDQDANVFFGVAPRDANEKVSRVTCLWVDIDGKNFPEGKHGALVAATKVFAAPPSFMVDSGNGYHCYWLLDEPIQPDRARSTMEEITSLLGADNTYDATRLLRVPGTLNRKDPEKFLACKILEARPDLVYKQEDLAKLTGVNPKTVKRMFTGDQRGYKSRSERDWAVIVELLKQDVSTDVIFLLFKTLPVGDKYHDEGEDYLTRTIAEARSSVARMSASGVSFTTSRDALFIVTPDGSKRCVATFVFRPSKLLHGPDEDVLLGTIKASGREWHGVALPKSCFAGTNALLKSLPNAFWQWVGSDREVRLLLPHLMEEMEKNGTPNARAVHYVGRVGDMWISPDTSFDVDNTYAIQDSPIVYIGSGRETPGISYAFPNGTSYRSLITSVFELLPQINVPSVVWPILGWYAAAPLKPLLTKVGIRFPVLNIYGSRGGGKTSTILRIMQPLFGYSEPRTYDCTTTQFVLLSLLASTNAVPVSFSEFRRSSMNDKELGRLMRYVLLSYDVGHDTRGRADQTTQDYPLRAPMTIDGEDAFADAAARERSILVNLDPGNIAVGSSAWEAFDELAALPLTDFAGNYVRETLSLSETDARELFDRALGLLRRSITSTLPDRVGRNYALCIMGLSFLKEHVERYGAVLPNLTTDFIKQAFLPCIDATVVAKAGRTSAMSDELVEDVINAVAGSGGSKPFVFRYYARDNVLYFHLSTALAWWTQKRRREGRPILESAAMKAQLREFSVETREGPGQYVVGRKAVSVDGSTHWCYGLNITRCHEYLDVPDKLDLTKIIINV